MAARAAAPLVNEALGAPERAETRSAPVRTQVIRSPDGRMLLFAACCLGLAAIIYLLALGRDDLLRVDADLRFPQIVGDWRLRDDASAAFSRISEVAFIGAAVLLLAGSLIGGLRRAVITACVVGAGPLVGWALSPILASIDPVGGEAVRASEGAFPSGHATIALSLGLGLIVALPARARIVGAILAVAPATVVAAGVVALGWHYPSDVAGAFLVSFAGAALVVAVAHPDRHRAAGRRAASWPLAVIVAGALVVAAGLGAAGLDRLPDESAGAFVDAHQSFVAYYIAVTVLTVAGVAVFAALLGMTRVVQTIKN